MTDPMVTIFVCFVYIIITEMWSSPKVFLINGDWKFLAKITKKSPKCARENPILYTWSYYYLSIIVIIISHKNMHKLHYRYAIDSDKFVIYDLRNHNYNKLIREALSGYRFILLFVTEESKQRLVRRFAELMMPFNRSVWIPAVILAWPARLHPCWFRSEASQALASLSLSNLAGWPVNLWLSTEIAVCLILFQIIQSSQFIFSSWNFA